MVKFRQKEFIAPLLATAGKAAMSMAPDLINAGATAISNNQNNELQKQAIENQAKQQKEQNKILNKAVKKDPVGVANVIQQQQPQQQQFSYLGRLGKKYAAQARRSVNDIVGGLSGINKEDVKGFGRDLKYSFNKNKDFLTAGVMATGAGILGSYVGNKGIKMWKDKKARDLEKQWEEEERGYSETGKKLIELGKTALNKVKETVSDNNNKESFGSHIKRVAGENKWRIAKSFVGGLGAAVLPFAAQEYMKRQMAKNTSEEPEEREYSKPVDYVKKYYRKAADAVVKGYRDVKNDPLKHIVRMKSHTNQERMGKFADNLAEGGSGSRITSLVGKMIKKHPKTSLIIGGSLAYAGKKGVQKATNAVYNGIRKVDKNAFSQDSVYDYYTNPNEDLD